MKKLKIGIIGVGRLGYEHACNIANRVPGSELVAIADANFDRAKRSLRSWAFPLFTRPRRSCALTRTLRPSPSSPIPLLTLR